MTSRAIIVGLPLAVLVGVTAFIWARPEAVTTVTMDDFPIDIAAGETLYAENCSACHGANLEGQADWQSAGPDGLLPAPPHDEAGHTWHHADSVLFNYVKLGGTELLAAQGIEFNSGMPGFADQLTDAEIWNILAYIKSNWPERHRAVQADRTAADISAQEN